MWQLLACVGISSHGVHELGRAAAHALSLSLSLSPEELEYRAICLVGREGREMANLRNFVSAEQSRGEMRREWHGSTMDGRLHRDSKIYAGAGRARAC